MTNMKATEFMQNVVRGLWPNWDLTQAQIQSWLGVLCQYDKEVTRRALDEYYGSKEGQYKEPKLWQFKTLVKKLHKQSCENYVIAFRLQKKGCPKTIPINMLGHEAADLELVRKRAFTEQKKIQELYGGEWLVIIGSKDVVDDGLRGQAAKDKAKRQILAGPDTLSRRFLLEQKTQFLKTVPQPDKRNLSDKLNAARKGL